MGCEFVLVTLWACSSTSNATNPNTQPKPTPNRSLETGHGAGGDEPASAEEVDAALEKMAEEVLGPVRGSLGACLIGLDWIGLGGWW